MKTAYKGKPVWKSTTAIHGQTADIMGAFRRFTTNHVSIDTVWLWPKQRTFSKFCWNCHMNNITKSKNIWQWVSFKNPSRYDIISQLSLRDVRREDSQGRFLAQHSIAMLNNVVTIRNNVATDNVGTLCCAKNRCCESPCVTSPLSNKSVSFFFFNLIDAKTSFGFLKR